MTYSTIFKFFLRKQGFFKQKIETRDIRGNFKTLAEKKNSRKNLLNMSWVSIFCLKKTVLVDTILLTMRSNFIMINF